MNSQKILLAALFTLIACYPSLCRLNISHPRNEKSRSDYTPPPPLFLLSGPLKPPTNSY